MINEIMKDAAHRMDQAVVHTSMELGKIRTGRANPEILEGITVDYYGTQVPINQVSNINIPEPRLILIIPYEKTVIPEIERAIINANIGLNPNNNGSNIMLPVPPLSEDRRKELIKVVHNMVEEGRIAVRNVRRDANQKLTHIQKEEHESEDEIKRYEKEIQELTDKHIETLNNTQGEKEKQLMEV